MIALAAFWTLASRSAAPLTISVAAADNDPLSQSLARSLLVRLGTLQGAESAHSIQLVDRTAKNADLNFKIRRLKDGGDIRADIGLVSSAGQAMLWSKAYNLPRTSQYELEGQIAFSAARVLDCYSEASGGSGQLTDANRRAYLNACATIAESGWDKRPVVPMLRRVLEQSPRFRPAWAKLLMAESDVVSFLISNKEPFESVREQLRNDVAEARKVDREMAEATLAEIELGDRSSIARSMTLVDKAKAEDPDNPVVLSTRSHFLQSAGRMNEAISDARRASELDPLAPSNRYTYILALTYAGQVTKAREELRQAKKLWPGARTIYDAEYALESRYGDFENVIRADENYQPAMELYLKARRDPSNKNVAEFLSYFRARNDPQVPFVLQALGEMNRIDEFFENAERMRAQEILGFDSYILFRPWIATARSDPRFMRLAKGIGLTDYWEKSGNWPDFCWEPNLPYDCRGETGKLH